MENPLLPIRPAMEQAISLLQNAVCQRIGIHASGRNFHALVGTDHQTGVQNSSSNIRICVLMVGWAI